MMRRDEEDWQELCLTINKRTLASRRIQGREQSICTGFLLLQVAHQSLDVQQRTDCVHLLALTKNFPRSKTGIGSERPRDLRIYQHNPMGKLWRFEQDRG